MGLKINHNISNLNTVRNLEKTTKSLEISNERMASGVSASAPVDGGAILSLTEQLRTNIAGFNQATQNTEAASSLIQVSERSLVEVSEQIRHLRALAVQAADEATQTVHSRDAIQNEVNKALETIDYIASNTTFGSKRLFDGSSAMQASAQGEGFTFVEGSALTEHELDKPHRIVMLQSATRNTTLGDIAFSNVLDHSERIVISEQNQQATYTVNPKKSTEENLADLQKAIHEAGVDVTVSLEGGSLRATHNQHGSQHVFRVQSQTPGLLTGGDDQNTEARIRRDIEEGILERNKTAEFLEDAAFLGLDIAAGAGLATIVIKNTPAYKGIKEDLLNASKEGLNTFKQSVLQQLELLNEFDFIVPSKFDLQPQSIIRLNQKQIMDFAISRANLKEGLNSIKLGDLAEKLIGQLNPEETISSEKQSVAGKAQQLLDTVSDEIAERLVPEILEGIRFLLGSETTQELVVPLRKGIPALLRSTLNNVGLSEFSQDLPQTTSNEGILEFVQSKFPEFIDNLPVRTKMENVVGALNPLKPDGGITPEDFVISAGGKESAFANNGRDVIGYFDEEPAIGNGRVFSGTNKFSGIYLRYDGLLDPGDKSEGAIVIKNPGLSFQVGNQANHQALFGLPSVNTFQLARDVKNGSAYSSLADIDFSTSRGASDAISLLDSANEEVTILRGMLGTFGASLDANVDALRQLTTGTALAENQISGTSFPEESMNWIQNQLQMDYQQAALIHGNISPHNVLSLVKAAY
ncbi:MAG: hypothetical protein HQM14_11300 [SAR324 cluster bacterium]|nr:hypothetical protein [SAR324 cluster bacterium]